MRPVNYLLAAAVRVAMGVPPGPRPPPTPEPGVDVDKRFAVEFVMPGHEHHPADGEPFKLVDGIAYLRECDRGKVEAFKKRKKAKREYGRKHK